MKIKVIFTIVSISITNLIFAQENIIWATKLIESNVGFESELNNPKLMFGHANIYPKSQLTEKLDAYSDGYILNQTKTSKKNFIKVQFPKEVTAKQIVIGGIFNKGTIYSILIADKNGIEKEIFKESGKEDTTKYFGFNVKFPQQKVAFLRILLNHSHINKWNLIKGVGLSAEDKIVKIEPNTEEWATEINEKIRIGEKISSKECFEINPKLTPDGKRLYFVKECLNNTDQDIWYSDLDDNKQWTEAKPAEKPLNNNGHNFVASISLDGRFLVLGNTYNQDGSAASDGVSISHRQEDGTWEVPIKIQIPDYVNKNNHSNFFMSSDEKVLIMASEDNMSNGNLDLYASFFDSYLKIWSPPMNLGKTINSFEAEDFPYLAPDGKTLFFSSKSYLGFGGHDIYMSKRLDDTWKNWSKPVNMGGNLNSKADDKGFAITSSGDHAYYNTVNFDSDLHHMDIFKVNLPKALIQQPQILVSGEVKNNSGLPLAAAIKVKNYKGEIIQSISSNASTGKYKMSIIHGDMYEFIVESDKYFISKSLLNLKDNMDLELVKNIELNPFLDSGYTETLEEIIFEPQTVKIKESEKQRLNSIIEKLIQQPNVEFEIGGYTAKEGSPKVLKDICYGKCKSISNYFVDNGIRESRIKIKPYVDIKPIAKGAKSNLKVNKITIKYLTKI